MHPIIPVPRGTMCQCLRVMTGSRGTLAEGPVLVFPKLISQGRGGRVSTEEMFHVEHPRLAPELNVQSTARERCHLLIPRRDIRAQGCQGLTENRKYFGSARGRRSEIPENAGSLYLSGCLAATLSSFWCPRADTAAKSGAQGSVPAIPSPSLAAHDPGPGRRSTG